MSRVLDSKPRGREFKGGREGGREEEREIGIEGERKHQQL